jgi:integrase/recombinase XerD
MNTLRQALQEYLSLRRGLGFKLQKAGKALLDFVKFMQQRRSSYITQALALAWAQQPLELHPASWAQRLSFVRGFARYRSATDPRTQVPPQGLLPFKPTRARPYLYSDDEVRRLLDAALKMPCFYKYCALRSWTYYCLFGLLSVSGLRLGEARNLELRDVDLDAAVLTIRGTKFGKSRLVPLHTSTCKVLTDYIARRKRHWARRPVSPYLFVSGRGNRLDAADVHRTFYALSRQIGLRGASASHGPRLHDMRHVFATNTLVRWYKSDQDPERRLPILSAYLGHVHVEDTQWYLSGSPELMREAMHTGSSVAGGAGHEYPCQLCRAVATLLYPTPDAGTSGEPAHNQFLPRYLSSISQVRAATAAQAALTAELRGDRRPVDRGVSG